jgi:hypothetical protein
MRKIDPGYGAPGFCEHHPGAEFLMFQRRMEFSEDYVW